MQITLAVLAEYCNSSQEGKLNIMGIFDTIFARKFPCVHPQMVLITKIDAEIPDSTVKERELTIQLVDEHANEIFSINGQFNFRNHIPGELATASSNIRLQNLPFKNPGNYTFKIFIDGQEEREIPLKVRKFQ